ncbi:MAG TPA: IclR family transcriptional regulator [Spirochaetia bacterium]|nr:IclR family transcriptional regulator [Spirochaetia bacterium]
MKNRVRPPKQTSIDVALNVLELFSAEKREIGITEMAWLLGKKVSTIHRTVTVLKNRGYIEQALQRGKYRLGLKTFELGCVYQNQSNVIREAMERLESLSRATNETINLAVLDQGMKEIAYIAKIDSPHVLKTDIQIGTKLLAHCTALGKVLLASLEEPVLDRLFPPRIELPTYTPKSISSTDQLRRKLAEIRKDGYALDNEEFRKEVVCVAMPYRDMNRKVVAAISVTGPAFRMGPARIEEIRKIMFELLGAA